MLDDAIRLSKLGTRKLASVYDGALQTAYPGIKLQITKRTFMNWPKEPWSNASYSFPRSGEVVHGDPFGMPDIVAGSILPVNTRVTRSWDTWKAR